jgi:sugar lactone lactonase YvrE
VRIAYGVALCFSTVALSLAPAASASHLAMPESALFHNGKIYVSLIGDPENNDGSVVAVDPTGKVTGTLAHASGTNPLFDPTGMAVRGSTLWVNDVTRIRSFDLRTGAAGRVIEIAGSIFVNDLAVDRRGNLWASDSERRMLYRVSAAGAVTRFRLPSGIRGLPNGVAVHPRTGEIWFVTFLESGGGAQVARLTAGARFVLVKTSPRLRQLDGLAFVSRTAYISDFGDGSIWRLSGNGTLRRRAVVAGSPADISYAPRMNRLLIPLIQRGHFTTLTP